MDEKKSSVSDMGGWGMNVVSSVGIIMAKKHLMSSSGYAFAFAVTFKNIMGMTVAVAGMIIYNWAVEVEKSDNHHAAKHSLTEEDIRLLNYSSGGILPPKDLELGNSK